MIYLAALFRGRVEEEKGSWAAAVPFYRAATSAAPRAEAGWTALAHAEDRAGDRPAAEAAVARVLAVSEVDPYRGYLFGPRGILEPLFDELRAEAVR